MMDESPDAPHVARTEDEVLSRILDLLERDGCAYEQVNHESVSSAAEAAAVRATALEAGTKALLMKFDDRFGIFALGAARQIRSAKIRRALRVRRTRFATRDELWSMTGLRPGAVPPFGAPVLPLPLFVDEGVSTREEMWFTAGARTVSIRIATADYLRLAAPEVLDLARD